VLFKFPDPPLKLSLRLDEHVEVQQADYDNGLLTLDLQRRVPDEVMAR